MEMDAEIVAVENVTPLHGKGGVEFPQEMKDAAFYLYAVECNHDAAAVYRLLLAHQTDEPIPTARTIRNWARAENWSGQSDEVWRGSGDRLTYAMRRGMLGNVMLAIQRNRDMLTGGLDDLEPWQAAMRAKGVELGMRLVERGVIALAAAKPPADATNDEGLSLHEQEARANARLVEQRKRAIGRGE
jgi:hypothetical protein